MAMPTWFGRPNTVRRTVWAVSLGMLAFIVMGIIRHKLLDDFFIGLLVIALNLFVWPPAKKTNTDRD